MMKNISNNHIAYNTTGVTLWQLLLMIAVSVLALLAPVVISGIWAAVFFAAVYGFFKDRMEYVWYGIAASPALEVWARMSAAPLLPYESGKYFLLFCIGLLFIQSFRKKLPVAQYHIGTILLVVLLPAMVVGLAHFDFEQWVFNILAIIEMALLLIFAARERWHIERFCRTLQISLIAIVCLLIYISAKVPAFADLEFSLKANASASGGFGSNQVSCILGAGIVLTVLLLLLNRPLFSIRWVNYLLLAYLLFRGLLTFSRGGMVVAIIAIAIAMMPKVFKSLNSFIKYTAIAILFTIGGVLVFYKVNDITGNMLLLRYEGETAGTIHGSKTKTFNTFLSGRGDVMMSDLEIFKDNWLFGVAPGQSKTLRRNYGYDMDVAAHTEYTRLMSEQGIGGLVAAIAMFLFPVFWMRKQHIGSWKGVIAALFALSILTAFHAAMRTNVTVVFYVLAAMPVLYEVNRKNNNHPIDNDSLHR